MTDPIIFRIVVLNRKVITNISKNPCFKVYVLRSYQVVAENMITHKLFKPAFDDI